MADTPNTGIPYVPEDTQDPASGLNLALNVIDALLQTAVIDMDLTAPPGSPSDGDLHIVAASATGAWAGQDNNLARYVAEGDFWQFYEAGVNAHLVLNKDDGGLYAWNGSAWVAPIAGDGGASRSYTIVTEASAFTADPGTHDGLDTYVRAGGNVTFDDAEPYTAGMAFNIKATASISLVGDGVTLNPTYGGTLNLEAGMGVQVVMTSPTAADVNGLTVASS